MYWKSDNACMRKTVTRVDKQKMQTTKQSTQFECDRKQNNPVALGSNCFCYYTTFCFVHFTDLYRLLSESYRERRRGILVRK